MKIDVKGIIEGWRNDLAPPKHLASLITETSKERLKICGECEYNSILAKQLHNYHSLRMDYHCTDCGCPLNKKTKCLSCSCPLGKWTALLTQEEESKIKEK